MRSAVLRNGAMFVRDDVTDPTPGQGEILVAVEACGICGSDLHFAQVRRGDARRQLADGGRRRRRQRATRPRSDVFMGHEFCGTVLDRRPEHRRSGARTVVTSVPIMVTATGIQDLAYTNL